MTRGLMTKTDPALIQVVLADAALSNCHAAARRNGVHPKTVYKWLRRREESGGTWPTDEYVVAWHTWRNLNGESQRRSAAQQREYLKRIYLQRGPVRIDATGTRRRLQALGALGWTGPQLASRLGVTPARVGHLITGLLDKVNRDTAAKVSALYDELSMIRPEDRAIRPARVVRVHDRQRRQAAAKGWVPPLGWNDIDDPSEQPADWQYTPARRVDQLQELVDRGDNLTQACRHLKLSTNTLNKWCIHTGNSHLYRALAAREGDWNSGGRIARDGAA